MSDRQASVMKPSFLAAVLVAATFALLAIARGNAPGSQAAVDAKGNLHVPGGYRTTYQFLGSWSIAAGEGQGAKEVHVVYASPGTPAAYQKTGHFPDGAVLVKEVYAAATASMTTGTVSHAGTLQGWFVMVKDAAGHHSGSLWGDGWGWSWFDAGNPSRTTSTDYKTDCLGCHVPAQSSDWVYVGGYPPLKP
jgi:Cytochrome P460